MQNAKTAKRPELKFAIIAVQGKLDPVFISINQFRN